jgi:hypothetical protein
MSSWNKTLPFEANEGWIEDIKTEFSTKVQGGKLVAVTDALVDLKLFLDLKCELDLDDRIWFAESIYILIISKSAGMETIKILCDICVMLLRDEEKLPSDKLNLEWKGLYELIYETLNPKHGRTYQVVTSCVSTLVKLADQANRCFILN